MHNKILRRRVSLITVLLAALISCAGQSLGQPQITVPKEKVSSADNLEIERQKLEIEKQKLQLERLAAWLTVGSIFLPLAVGLFAIHSQVKTAFQIKEAEAKSAFELKAAEIVMNSENPFSAYAKAEALLELFPNRIPKNFAAHLKPDELSGPGIEELKILLPLLMEHTTKRQEILGLWKQILPADTSWIDEMKV